MKKRIGLLTSGGDCPGINTAIDAIVKTLESDYEVIGFYEGFEGLLNRNYILLDSAYTSANRWIGGSILKTATKGHFPNVFSDNMSFDSEQLKCIEIAHNIYDQLDLEGLIVIGGDGSLYTSYGLSKHGFKIIGIPKSIENDLAITDTAIGFQTATETAHDALNRLHTTASSMNRVVILEVIGETSGWMALHTGLSGGANIILIPEIPFSLAKINEFITDRYTKRSKSTIIVVARGSTCNDLEVLYSGPERRGSHRYSISSIITQYINQKTEFEAYATNIELIQRGGSTGSADKVLATQMAVMAANMAKANEYNQIVVLSNGKIKQIPLDNSVLGLKLVSQTNQLLSVARTVGITFAE
jgi:ATP-dependent phosphofructokinase / diphosphate-dependent phosphofructokinase